MSLKITQKGGKQITAPQQNKGVFTELPYASPERNVFNLSKQCHGSMRFGYLYPVYSRMLMPGDSFTVKPSHYIQFASVVSPILNKISISYASFFVPFRLVWKFFPTFISGGYNNDGVYTDDNGNYLNRYDEPTSNPFTPQLPTINVLSGQNIGPGGSYDYAPFDGSLLDWLGFPTFENADALQSLEEVIDTVEQRQMFNYNALPLMCYQKIINDWFINTNIKNPDRVNSLPPSNCSGMLEPKAAALGTVQPLAQLAYINYGLDYFTSALPYLQRGDTYTIQGKEDSINFVKPTSDTYNDLKQPVWNQNGGNDYNGETLRIGKNNSSDSKDNNLTDGLLYQYLDVTPTLQLKWNTTIQELRYVNALQTFAEKSLRVGTRYIDFLKCYFDVTSSDKSLQRSEFLGSSTFDIKKSIISQTSAVDGSQSALIQGSPLGTKATQLQSIEQGSTVKCFAEEHGMLIVLACITPETIYKNRMRTEYLYNTKEDFLFPEFTHLSPQAIKNQELWFPRTSVELQQSSYEPNGVFGYQDRYNELRTDTNDVHGDFKNNLSFFLQMRDFATMPKLNTEFLSSDDIDYSIFASDKVRDSFGQLHEVSPIWASFDFDVKATRLLPKLSTPRLI